MVRALVYIYIAFFYRHTLSAVYFTQRVFPMPGTPEISKSLESYINFLLSLQLQFHFQ
jgi:hypothetical protein